MKQRYSFGKQCVAIWLCISLLCGMMLGSTALPVVAETTVPVEISKFTADFSELAAIAEDGGAFADTTYIRPGYATETDKAIKAWVDARFDMVSGYGKNMNRALLGQSSSSLTTSKDTWSGENYWSLMQAGYIQQTSKNSGQVYRLSESFVPKVNGKQAVLANFEAKLTFSVAAPQGQPHGILVAFHEKTAGFTRNQGDHVFQAGTGSMVMINNGAGSYTKASGFGMFIYDQNNTYGKDGAPARAPLSAIVSNSKDGTTEGNYNYYANRNIDGEVFENNLVGNTKYDLIVRVVGTKVTATVKDMDGNVMYTKEKTLEQAGEGYFSFGSSNAANRFYAIEVTELDEEGNAVDFGTKTAKDEVETLKIDFSDLPEVQWYDGKYYYNADHDTSDVSAAVDMSTDFLTAGNTTYVVNQNDAILVDDLESKLAFYYSQEGNSFERPNVNGYAVSDTGVEYTAKTGDVNAYAPDTKVSLGKYVDGIGYSGNSDKGIAKWYLDGNKYLAYTNNSKTGDSMFRKSGSIALKDKNGDLLQIDNFKLDLDFKLYADGTYDYSNIAVGFHANQPYIECGRKTQAMFAISPTGGYFLGDNFDLTAGKIFNKSTGGYDDFTTETAINFTNQSTKHATTTQRAAIYPFVSETKVGHNALAHLTLTVVGNTATAKVTKGEEVILEKTVTLGTHYSSGYLFLSGSNQQGWYSNIEVTRLDVNGNPVDFSDDTEGFDFGESFDAKATYYYKDSKFYRNTDADMFWMQGGNATYYTFNDPTTYADDAATVAHLKETFDFWAYNQGSVAQLAEPYQSTEDVFGKADDYLKGAKSYLHYTTEGLTVYPESTGGGEAIRKGFTIVPKLNGAPIKARNVELMTDLVMTNDQFKYSMWNVSLRSEVVGQLTNGNNMNNNKYTDHLVVQVRPEGVNIVDGGKVGITNADITGAAGYQAYNDGEKHYNVRVYVKALNNKLTVKVTDLKTDAVLFEVSGKAVSHVSEGYIALTSGQAMSTVSNLYVNILNHVCNFTVPKFDQDYHWYECECGEISGKQAHTIDSNTQTCACGYVCNADPFYWTVKDLLPYVSSKYTVSGYDYYTYEGQTTDEAKTVIAALNSNFDLYYNSESRYVQAQHGVKQAYDGQTKDYGRFATVYGNTWLEYSVSGAGGDQNMRLINALVPKGDDGNHLFAQNFETTFRARFETAADGPSIVFGARQQQPGKFVNNYFAVNKQQAVVVLTPLGISVGAGKDIFSGATNHVGIQGDFYDTNATATFDTPIPAKTAVTVYVKAVGDQMTVKVTAGGKTYYEATHTVPYTEAGTFAYGVANRKSHLGDIELYHLDDNGRRIEWNEKSDFEESLNVTHYNLSFTDLPDAEFRSNTVGDTTATVYIATATDKSVGYNYVSFPELPSTQALDYVMSKADFYYNHQGRAWEKVSPCGNDSTNEGSGDFILFFNKWLQRTGVSKAKNLVDRVNAVVPKLDDGSQIRARNLHVSFHYRFENGSLGTDGNSTAVLALRQKNPAEFMMGTDLMNTDQVLIAITQKSIAVAGGKDITAERFIGTGQFADDACGDVFSSALPQEIWVEVTAVDEKIHLRIASSGGNIVYDETFETGYLDEGTVAFGVSGRSGNIGELNVWRMNNDGIRVDIDTDFVEPTFEDGKQRFVANFARLASMAKNGYVTTDDDEIINAWVADKFELYHDREEHLVVREHLGQSSDVCDTTQDPYNTGYTYFRIQDGMLTRESTKDGLEWMRKGDVLVPKTAYGMPVRLKNFETTFTVVDTDHAIGAVAFSFRNDTPGKIVDRYQTIYANQQAVMIGVAQNGAGVSVGGEFTSGTAGDYYNADETVAAISKLERYQVYVKAVGENVTMRVTTEGGAIVYEKKYIATSTEAGYLSLGVYNSTKSIVDWTITELDDTGNAIDFGAAQDAKNIVLNGNRVTVATDDGYMLEAGSLILKDANGVEFVPTRVDFQGSVNGASNVYEVTDEVAVAPFTVADANFVKPTLDNPNIGNVGTSCSEEKKGLRFVSRFSRTVENGTEYLVAADGKFEIVDYGMLVCLTNYLGDRELTLETAAADRFISNMSAKQRGTYYDRSREQVDMSVCILNMAGDDWSESVSARAYIIVKDAEGKEVVRYADTFMSTYARNHVSTPAE